MVRFILTAAVTAAIFVAPAFQSSAQDQPIRIAQAEKAKADKTEKTAKARKQREPSAGRKAARVRQKQCGAEWRAAKKAGTTAKGQRWPQFWSACNKRLKAKKA